MDTTFFLILGAIALMFIFGFVVGKNQNKEK